MRLKYVYTKEEQLILHKIMQRIKKARQELIAHRKRLDNLQSTYASIDEVMNANKWVWRDYYEIDALLNLVIATHGIATYDMHNRLLKYVLHGRTK